MHTRFSLCVCELLYTILYSSIVAPPFIVVAVVDVIAIAVDVAGVLEIIIKMINRIRAVTQSALSGAALTFLAGAGAGAGGEGNATSVSSSSRSTRSSLSSLSSSSVLPSPEACVGD